MSFPTTRAELEAAGYERSSYSRCKGCGMAMEWWTTPNGKPIPMDSMAQPDSPAVSHFATCLDANRFRKEPQRCISPTSTSQDSQPSLFSQASQSSPPTLKDGKYEEKKGDTDES